METAIAIGSLFVIMSLLAWRWVKGIEYMNKNYPDYKGEDLFDEDKNKK